MGRLGEVPGRPVTLVCAPEKAELLDEVVGVVRDQVAVVSPISDSQTTPPRHDIFTFKAVSYRSGLFLPISTLP